MASKYEVAVFCDGEELFSAKMVASTARSGRKMFRWASSRSDLPTENGHWFAGSVNTGKVKAAKNGDDDDDETPTVRRRRK